MQKGLFLFIIFALVACSKSNEQEQSTNNDYVININPQTVKCGENSKKNEKIHTLVRDLILKNEPNETGGYVVNTKATEYAGEKNYRSVSIGEQVKEYCTENGYSFIATASDSHIFENSGWVLESDLKQKTGDKYEGKISSFVIKEKAPGYYKGEIEKFLNIKPRIHELEVLAAKKVIDSGKCDLVESSIIDRFGKDIENPSFEVECRNGNNFKLSRKEIINESDSVVSNLEKSISQSEAVEECKKLIKSYLTQEHKAKFHEIVGTTYNVNSKNGNVALIMNFSAENALGQKDNFKANCIFSPDGGKEVAFKND